MQLTGEHCGLCTRIITGRNRDDVTILNDAGYEERRRVCTYCFAVFNLLTGTDEANAPVQEGFGELLNSILMTRNARVRQGKIGPEYDVDDQEGPPKLYTITGRPFIPQHLPRKRTIPDWMPAEEVALLQGLPKTTYTSVTSGPPVILAPGAFEECAACDKEARPGLKYCEDCKEYEES